MRQPHHIQERIDRLRAAMREHGLVAWIVLSSDPHLSEYLPGRWQGREWLSGFTGSVGSLVVTVDFAGLWVDSRYWLQADSQLAGTGIATMRAQANAGVAFIDWLAERCGPKDRVGVDGRCLGLSVSRMLRDALYAKDAELVAGLDLLDSVWEGRPGLPSEAVFEQQAAFAPVPRAGKLRDLRQTMRSAHAAWHLISSLDDIAWVLNLRGNDVPYNPVFVAHLLFDPDGATLFISAGKVDGALRARLAADGVALAPYEDLAARMAKIPAGESILVDPRRVTAGVLDALGAGVRRVEQINPTTMAKAVKTEAEIAFVRRTMEQDGAALAEFFAWFEQAMAAGETVTELTIDEKITQARQRRAAFFSPSFATIAGFNANGAQPHYRATEEAHSVIRGAQEHDDGLLLIDSGGQYQTGTTDITRVVAVGTPSCEQRADFTRVLKGMIALSQARFPRGTRSPLLDSLARAPIWSAGIDYGHGTGHGVGYFLNVHEGPHGITPFLAPEPQTALVPGMITSNEPGIYRPGRWGVRIENLLVTVPAGTTEFGDFLKFETLTLCPIDIRCIDRSLLTGDEVQWLNGYHATVRERVGPLVGGAAAAWLEASTRLI
jgi:Xaa-Pro aminopeptidase